METLSLREITEGLQSLSTETRKTLRPNKGWYVDHFSLWYRVKKAKLGRPIAELRDPARILGLLNSEESGLRALGIAARLGFDSTRFSDFRRKLAELLVTDPNPSIRKRAAQSLFGIPFSATDRRRYALLEVTEALRADHPQLAIEVIKKEAFIDFSSWSSPVDEKLAQYTRKTTPKTRLAIAQTLEPDSYPATLEALLTSKDPEASWIAARMATSLKSPPSALTTAIENGLSLSDRVARLRWANLLEGALEKLPGLEKLRQRTLRKESDPVMREILTSHESPSHKGKCLWSRLLELANP